MTDPVTFTLDGIPQGKGRARAYRRGNHIGHYTPEPTRAYEGMIRVAASVAMDGRPPLAGPVEFVLRAVMPVRASWPKRKRAAALCGELRPTGRPDLDNVVKAATDAANSVVFADDAQIVRVSAEKVYGPRPQIIITVRPLDGAPQRMVPRRPPAELFSGAPS